MTITHGGIRGGCPYDLVSGSISECAGFDPRIVTGTPQGAIITCAHARPSIARPAGGGATIFYSRCAIRSGEVEAERDFAVPLD